MQDIRIVDLRTEFQTNPVGIDNPKPMLSWRIESNEKGVDIRGLRYTVELSPDETMLKRRQALFKMQGLWMWQYKPIAFTQAKLQSRQRIYWRVRLNHPSVRKPIYSEVAFFEMGLLNRSDWVARWIAPSTDARKPIGVCKQPDIRPPEPMCPMMRYEFTLPDVPFERARLYITGLGYYEAYLNGRKVGHAVLEPAFTRFDKRVEYRTYDVAEYLQPGRNCIGAMLGQGWWEGPLCLLAQLELTYPDGDRLVIATNPEWLWKPSPIVSNSIYKGETYDARLEQPDWCLPNGDTADWQPVRTITMPRTMELSASFIEPIQVVETLTPQRITEPKPGVRVYDLGQNISGWCRIQVRGARGAKVILRHAELLYPDGTINPENLRSADSIDTYILKGDGLETYEPRFTYHGFRYVQVETESAETSVQIEKLEGRVVHTAFERRGHFECSNPLLNRIHQNAVWGFRTNFHSIPTDCPQRDERQGWLGDAHIAVLTGLYNFSTERAYRKFLRDMADEQGSDGSLPDTVPFVWGSRPGDPMWTCAYSVIHHALLSFLGHYPEKYLHQRRIDKHIEHLANLLEDGVLELSHYGDWVALEETPKPLVSSCALLLMIRQRVLTLEHMVDYFFLPRIRRHPVWKTVQRGINTRYYNPEGYYDHDTQTANLLPLYLGIVPEEAQDKVLESLVRSIVERHGGHLATGFVGTRYLLDTLTRYGYGDLAYTIATQTTYPSWGYMIENGATTIWELWQYADGPGMNSHNHPAFGSIDGWLYQDVAGIRPQLHDGQIEYKPHLLGDLQWAFASVNLPIGEASIRWERSEHEVRYHIRVPVGVFGKIDLPVQEAFVLYEGDTLLYPESTLLYLPPWYLGISLDKHKNLFRIVVLPGTYTFRTVFRTL